MVAAGLRAAVELAELAMEETHFGVFEDKVFKNYIATEFLYDYLKDKKSVGVIEEEPERGIQYVAEPIGVVLALTPITNPTSTVLFKAIVAAKTRNAIIFRPSARASRCAIRCVEILQEAGEGAGLPGRAPGHPRPDPGRLPVPLPPPGLDFIWTTGGPKAVAAANAAGKPCISVGPGNAPIYIHGSADIRMAVVDVLISKTFDSSVICPAEQTCVIDGAVYDDVVRSSSGWARICSRVTRSRCSRARLRGRRQPGPCGPRPVVRHLGSMADFGVPDDAKVLLAPLPTALDALGSHPFIQEKLMPILGIVRSPSPDHAIAACELVTEHGGMGHTSAVYATDQAVIDRFAESIRTGRILVNAPTAVGALGGVYNSMTPTFSLGCGTWGGSTTTDNVNYRNLLNIKTVSRRQAPPQWFRVPSDTYFNPGAIENLRQVRAEQVLLVTDAGLEARGVADEVRSASRRPRRARLRRDPARARPRPRCAPASRSSTGCARTRSSRSAVGPSSTRPRRCGLFHESPELSLEELSLPFLDARKRVAQYPQSEHSVRLIALPTTAGTGSEVSPAAVLTVDGAKLTLVDYSLVPDIAIVDPLLTLTMPPAMTADTGIDALTHALEGAVSIFASPYTDAFCVQATYQILGALPARTRTAPTSRRAPHGQRGDDRRARVLKCVRRGEPRARACRRCALRDSSRPRKRDLPAPRPPLQRVAAVEVHARPELHGVCRAGEVRPDRLDRRAWWTQRKRARRAPVQAGGGAPGCGRHAAFARCSGDRRAEFEAALPDLVRMAFADPSVRTNPRIPLVTELHELLVAGWRGW